MSLIGLFLSYSLVRPLICVDGRSGKRACTRMYSSVTKSKHEQLRTRRTIFRSFKCPHPLAAFGSEARLFLLFVVVQTSLE